MASGDRISSMARRDIDRLDPCDDPMTEGLMDEAFFTSFVEGAPISRLECRRFLKSGEDPSGVGELLAQNNLSAIRHMVEHRYEPYSGHMLLTWARLLTNAMDGEVDDYRLDNTHIIPGRTLTPQIVPLALEIPGMMDSLCIFLNEYEMHPLLKAAIAQAYILLVRPYDEGSERLARLLSYSILLRKGYSFFRQFALSGMIAQDGMLYYKAMETFQDVRGEGDLTCFLEYYLGMLSRSVNGFDAYLAQKRREQEEMKRAMPETGANRGSPQAESQQKLSIPSSLSKESVRRAQHESHGSNNAVKKRKQRKEAKEAVLLSGCTTPESLLAFIVKSEMNGRSVEDANPYFEHFRITNLMILASLRNINTDVSRRILAMYRMFQQNPGRQYSYTEIENALQIRKETARRTCCVLIALKLIQRVESIAAGSKRQICRFCCGNTMAA
jgi:Fic family protein